MPLFLLSLFSMNRLVCLLFILALPLLHFGQIDSNFKIDSLSIVYRTGGNLDTVDKQSHVFSASFPLLNAGTAQLFPKPELLFSPEIGILQGNYLQNNRLIFTALPHIGFAYVFGAQGTQRLTFNYEQSFRQGFMVNATIKRDKTTGFLRNSAIAGGAYELKIGRAAKRYSFLFSGVYANENRSWNGGIVADSLSKIYAPTLIPVRKENALTQYRNIHLNLLNRFSFWGDSIDNVGFLTEHHFTNYRRVYSEEDTLYNLYSFVYQDSTNSNDTLQTNYIQNAAAFYLKKNNFVLQAGARANNWNYSTYNLKRDTLEIDIYEKLVYKWKQFDLQHNGYLNLIGAGRGMKLLTTVTAPIIKGKLILSHLLSNEYPQLFQRHFSSNNVIYQLNSLELQTRQSIKLELQNPMGWKGVSIAYNLMTYKKNYVYDASLQTWRNDLSISSGTIHKITVNGALHLKNLHFYPGYQFVAMDNAVQFHPQHSLFGRLMFQGGIFKAKKLKFALGVDFALNSKFKSLNFIPQMSILDPLSMQTSGYQNSFINAGVFTSFEVETFRFFIRMDNLGTFWTDKTTSLINGYTFPSTQIKLGVTWDFWN